MTKTRSGRGRSKAKGKARAKAAVTPTSRTPDAVSEGLVYVDPFGPRPLDVDPALTLTLTGQGEEVKTPSDAEVIPPPSPPLELYEQSWIVEAIVRLLVVNEKICRPPRQAAKLLAYIADLYSLGKPFPSRAEVSALLNMSIPTIDAALSSRLQEGYIDVDMKIVEGNIERRPSSIRQRYYRPSSQLLEAIDTARQRGQVRK